MAKYLYINEETGERIGFYCGFSPNGTASDLIRDGKAERVLVVQIVSRVSKRVEIETDVDNYPEVPEEATFAEAHNQSLEG